MKRQGSTRAKSRTEVSKTTKTLGVLYAEVLRLREAVEKTKSRVKLSSPVASPSPKQDRASSFH